MKLLTLITTTAVLVAQQTDARRSSRLNLSNFFNNDIVEAECHVKADKPGDIEGVIKFWQE